MSVRVCAALVVCTLSTAVAGASDVVRLGARLEALAASYPADIAGADGNELVFKDGHRIVIDDGKPRTHEQMLENGDIKDMLSQIYPVGGCYSKRAPQLNFEPGRIRNAAFFARIYGSSEAAVRGNLTSFNWFGQTLPVTRTAGADRALSKVREDVAKLGSKLQDFLTPSAGTFVWRPIAGTARLSAHSWGIAIDINTRHSDYWRWAKASPAGAIAFKNRIPMEIVQAFERHGFIWGGKWYHYDTMHFEYRPELIRIGKLAEKAGCEAAAH